MDDIDLTHFINNMTTIIELLEHVPATDHLEEAYLRASRLRDEMATARKKIQDDQIYKKMEKTRDS